MVISHCTMMPILIRTGIVSGTKPILPFCLATFCGDINPNYRISNKKNKLGDPSPRANYTDQSDRRLSAKLVPTFAESRSERTESPMTVILIFQTGAPTSSFKQLFNCTHEDGRNPSQTHYLSENLVALGNEPGPLNL
jgi:hypothetical protein